MADKVLLKEFKELSKENWVQVDLKNENIFAWDIALIVLNPSSLYYGGYFKAEMTFPKNYPYEPPTFRFTRPLLHPNVYKDGKLCISILHTPGEDIMSGELASERWSPAQRVESVLISILSLLDDAEVSSPANVDAGVLLRNNPDEYKRKVKECVEASKADIPEGFVMPGLDSVSEKNKPVPALEDDRFWIDSDGESEQDEEDDEGDMSFEEDEDDEDADEDDEDNE